MYTQPRNLMLATGIALALSTIGGSVAAGATSQELIEARQESQIWTTYALSPYLRANDLKVAVHDGKATLTGKVEEDVNKDLAKQIALGVDGVKEVDNQILIESDYKAPAHSSARAYGEAMDDASVTAAVRSKLMWSKYTSAMSTGVSTKAGKVTLKGSAESQAAKDFARSLAMNTPGVKSVDNQLLVDGAKPVVAQTSKAPSAGTEIADSWITTKVKSTYGYSSNVNGSDIGVSTDSGIVTLTGKVDSGAERALAIELAQNVRGVKSVQSKALTF